MWSYQSMAHGADSLMYFRYRGATKGAEQFCYGVIDADNASDEETVLTQQEICNACFLPKQTVNTAIAGLAQKGLVELELIPGPRNKKRILLTDAGRELEKNTTDRLRGAVYFPTAPFLFVRKKLVNKTRVCKNRHETDAEAS